MFRNAIIAGVLAAFVAASAHAQNRCFNSEQLQFHLLESFGEDELASGREPRETYIRIYVDPEDGSWTVVRHFVNDGVSCIIGAGEGFTPGRHDTLPLEEPRQPL